MTAASLTGSLDEARQFYTDAGVPFPPVPAELEPQIAKQGDSVFGTRPAEPPLYALEAWVDDAVRGSDFLLFGMDGHGYNSWATHFYLVKGRLALLLQASAGGALMDPAEDASRIEGLWELASTLVDRVAEAERLGKLPEGKRLVVIDSDLGGSRWAWVDPTSSAEPGWQVAATTPAFAAAMDLSLRIQGKT